MPEHESLIKILKAKGIKDHQVLNAISIIPRHLFVEEDYTSRSNQDVALPIEFGQTISQPYVIAKIMEVLLVSGPTRKVLEIGTGSGYQAVIAAQLFQDVYSVERIEKLYIKAKALLEEEGVTNIHLKYADGFEGWADYAPYDAIIVAAAVSQVPQALKEQLADGGVLIIPLGDERMQTLFKITRQGSEYKKERIEEVIFVPMLSGLA